MLEDQQTLDEKLQQHACICWLLAQCVHVLKVQKN